VLLNIRLHVYICPCYTAKTVDKLFPLPGGNKSITALVIGCEDRLRNDLLCVEWDVKPYTLHLFPLPLALSGYAYELCCNVLSMSAHLA